MNLELLKDTAELIKNTVGMSILNDFRKKYYLKKIDMETDLPRLNNIRAEFDNELRIEQYRLQLKTKVDEINKSVEVGRYALTKDRNGKTIIVKTLTPVKVWNDRIILKVTGKNIPFLYQKNYVDLFDIQVFEKDIDVVKVRDMIIDESKYKMNKSIKMLNDRPIKEIEIFEE